MKKITLFAIALLASVVSFAALNPYAYGLSSALSADETKLTVNYSLNADATAVNIVVLYGEKTVKSFPCEGIAKGTYSVEIPTTEFPKTTALTWKVEVSGASVKTPTLHDESIRFCLPYGMDIDVDPESDYMGNWYVIEATNSSQSKTGYQSNPLGRGLYAFDATLNPILNSAGTRGFLGGVNAGYTEKNINEDFVNFYRVATSGGRVFIDRYRDEAAYHPIVEANPADLNEPFTSVFTTGRAVSIDAIGSGKNLKLVMLAKDNNIYEYDLGNAKSIAAASRTINNGSLSILRDDATITYDNNGGIWFNQNRGTATEASPTIAHLTASGVDYNNVKAGLTHNNTSNSGIAVSPDGKQLAVVGAGTKNITIYNIDNTDGYITLTKAYSFAVSAGSNHTALSWDYAGNLFAANRSSERIRIFAMPYSGMVATPTASKYAFQLQDKVQGTFYTLTTNVDATMGKVTGNDGQYLEGTEATITAVANRGHKFLNWTVGEETKTENPGTGQQIAIDEAGNLIVFNAYFATSTPNNILIYAKGSTEGKAVSFTLSNPGQCHFFTASGDIYSAEGGYVYFYCQNTIVVNRLKITNGAATETDVTADIVGDNITAGNSQNHVMVDIFGNLAAHSRSNGVSSINVHNNASSKTFAATLSGIKLSTLGGCTFELGGKEFWAYNVGTTDYNSEWNIYNMTDEKLLSETAFYAKNTTDINTAANWFNVQVVDEKTAYIYQFCPTVAVAVWKVTCDTGEEPENPTVLDNTVVAPQVEKIVRNGQVLIIRDGKTFNMMGQEVK